MPRESRPRQPLCIDIDGFRPHAAVRCEAADRKRLEQLYCSVTRPSLSGERVQRNAARQVVLGRKTPWRDGNHASGDIAAGVHAAAGRAGATALIEIARPGPCAIEWRLCGSELRCL